MVDLPPLLTLTQQLMLREMLLVRLKGKDNLWIMRVPVIWDLILLSAHHLTEGSTTLIALRLECFLEKDIRNFLEKNWVFRTIIFIKVLQAQRYESKIKADSVVSKTKIIYCKTLIRHLILVTTSQFNQGSWEIETQETFLCQSQTREPDHKLKITCLLEIRLSPNQVLCRCSNKLSKSILKKDSEEKASIKTNELVDLIKWTLSTEKWLSWTHINKIEMQVISCQSLQIKIYQRKESSLRWEQDPNTRDSFKSVSKLSSIKNILASILRLETIVSHFSTTLNNLIKRDQPWANWATTTVSKWLITDSYS